MQNTENHIVTDTDILIVGAGPVGLFLANECARRGLRWRIVEARSSQSEHSKALAIMPRTLEIFDMAGIVESFVKVANQVTWASVMVHNRRLAHIQFTPEDSPYPFIAMVPQDVTERLLMEELQRKGGAVEYETSFVSAAQHDNYVKVTLGRKGEQQELTSAFVVGCDGAHSAIRHFLELPFDGGQYKASFLLADIETNETLPANEMQLCPSEFGPLAIFPMSNTRRRIVATVDTAEGDAPSLELIKYVLAQRGPSDIEAQALIWSSYFRIHHRQVKQMRVGRIFVAGDAAHIHSPFGGQGMNTGLHDAWNLIWKLDLVLRGHGIEQLLDSYTSERFPIIKQVINLTDLMTKAMGTPNIIAQTLRNAVIPVVSRLAPFQHAFVQRLSQLGIEYGGSPIVEGPGKRYLDDSMRGGKGITSRFLIIADPDINASIIHELVQFSESHRDIIELRLKPCRGLLLVRPDGYLAYSTNNSCGEMASLRTALERHTRLATFTNL